MLSYKQHCFTALINHSVWLGCELGQMTNSSEFVPVVKIPKWCCGSFYLPHPDTMRNTCNVSLTKNLCHIKYIWGAQNTHNICGVTHWYMDIWHSEILALNLKNFISVKNLNAKGPKPPLITAQHISAASWGGVDAAWLLDFFFLIYFLISATSTTVSHLHIHSRTHTNTHFLLQALWSARPLPVWSCSLATCRAWSVGWECWTVIFINGTGWMSGALWGLCGALSCSGGRAAWKKEAQRLAPGSLLSLFKQQIDTLCPYRPLFEPPHSSAQLYLLHYQLPIIPVYRTNKAICPVSTCLAGGC